MFVSFLLFACASALLHEELGLKKLEDFVTCYGPATGWINPEGRNFTHGVKKHEDGKSEKMYCPWRRCQSENRRRFHFHDSERNDITSVMTDGEMCDNEDTVLYVQIRANDAQLTEQNTEPKRGYVKGKSLRLPKSSRLLQCGEAQSGE